LNASEESKLPEHWRLTPADHALVVVKGRANRLGFAVLLLFFRERGRFPRGSSEVDPRMVGEVARQIHLPAPVGHALNLSGRTAERHRAEVRALVGYRESTVADAEALEDWLRDQAAAVGAVADHLVARLEARCRELAIEPPSADRVERIVRAAIHAHEEHLYARIRGRLTRVTRARLEGLLQPESEAGSGPDGDGGPGTAPALLLRLRGDPGRPSLAERMLRAQALGRRNWTFLGSDHGGRTAAVLYSLTGSCRHHDIDPFAYLDDILRRLPSHPVGRLADLLPDVWFAANPSARRKTAA
jgi:hypothetical protein